MKTLVGSFDLRQTALGRDVQVDLYRGADKTNVQHIGSDWEPWFNQQPGAGDEHWKWEEKLSLPKADPLLYDILLLEAEGTTQALMLVKKGGLLCVSRHADHPRKPTIYVDRLSTAPWNRKPKSNPVRFRGCGQLLIGAAVSLSFDEGFNGRIGLHSLVDAESFYRDRIGMTEFPPDPHYEGLRYFELSETQAIAFLSTPQTTRGG